MHPVKPLIQRAIAEDLMLFYNLPAFSKGDDTAFLSALARANNLVKKAGELDLVSASRIVLRDWSTDNLPRYSVPSSAAIQTDQGSQNLYATDGATLEAALTRKELRKGRGLIKLVPLEVETRKLALDENWDDEESDEEEVEEMAGVDEVEVGESGSEDEEVIEEAEEAEEASPPPPPVKRKRQANPPTISPRKKVAFDVKAKPAKRSPSTTKPSKSASKKGRK